MFISALAIKMNDLGQRAHSNKIKGQVTYPGEASLCVCSSVVLMRDISTEDFLGRCGLWSCLKVRFMCARVAKALHLKSST